MESRPENDTAAVYSREQTTIVGQGIKEINHKLLSLFGFKDEELIKGF